MPKPITFARRLSLDCFAMSGPNQSPHQSPSQSTGTHPSPLVRALILGCGALALVLAAIGVVLPGLPTTPFVLVAGACFVRASPRAHAWLLASRVFGPALREWEAHHTIPRRAKLIALLMMATSVSVSVWYFSGRPWLQLAIVGAAAVGIIAITLIPTRR